MSWTVIYRDGDTFSAAALILSFDFPLAWEEALTQYPTTVGMLKGNHAPVWRTLSKTVQGKASELVRTQT